MPSSVDRQLGELSTAVKGIVEDISEIKEAQNQSGIERTQQIKEVLSRIDTIERTTELQHRDNSLRLEGITKEITSMKEPVAQFVSMRRLLGTIFAFSTAVIGLLWWFGEPIYKLVVEKWLGIKS